MRYNKRNTTKLLFCSVTTEPRTNKWHLFNSFSYWLNNTHKTELKCCSLESLAPTAFSHCCPRTVGVMSLTRRLTTRDASMNGAIMEGRNYVITCIIRGCCDSSPTVKAERHSALTRRDVIICSDKRWLFRGSACACVSICVSFCWCVIAYAGLKACKLE